MMDDLDKKFYAGAFIGGCLIFVICVLWSVAFVIPLIKSTQCTSLNMEWNKEKQECKAGIPAANVYEPSKDGSVIRTEPKQEQPVVINIKSDRVGPDCWDWDSSEYNQECLFEKAEREKNWEYDPDRCYYSSNHIDMICPEKQEQPQPDLSAIDTNTEIILGRVSLNAYKIKNRPTPVIEILASDGDADGDIVVLKVLKRGR